ncbi:MAG: hypothetical protein ABI698_01440 [bacterium]
MAKKQILWAAALIITIAAVVALALKSGASLGRSADNASPIKGSGEHIVQTLKDAQVVAFTKWSVGESEDDSMACIVRSFKQDPNYKGAGVKLTIQDQLGKVVFEEYFSDVSRIYSSYALRKPSPQLVLEVDYGGSTNFIKVLDYQNGNVIDLMDAVKMANEFATGAEVRPQLRTGVNAAIEPYEIFLTQGIGLASPAQKITNVFRYKDGRYRYFGQFPQEKVDDHIEDLLKHSKGEPASRND